MTPQTSEQKTLKHSLKTSILLAFERLGTEPYNVDNMINDVITEFPRTKENDFVIAIRNGSLGKYGKTYKLCTQDICIWVREYLKSKLSTLL
jgi:hypothetical protein